MLTYPHLLVCWSGKYNGSLCSRKLEGSLNIVHKMSVLNEIYMGATLSTPNRSVMNPQFTRMAVFLKERAREIIILLTYILYLEAFHVSNRNMYVHEV